MPICIGNESAILHFLHLINADQFELRHLFTRALVVDGNFHADHIHMKRPEDDVRLMDGSGYMVENDPYQIHLSTPLETMEVSSLLLTFSIN
jgi:hypothetical protein